MYISYNWLQDFVKLPSKTSYLEVADKLTAHTVEVESTVSQANNFKNVVVGEVLEVNKHPNADRLKTTIVDVGNEKLNIVCGASNIEAGQKVPVALVGANLPNGLEIKESKIRGEVSRGMVCAEDELGLGSEHEGIMVLDKKAKVGKDFADHLKVDDIVLEVDNKSLSNRPDLLSHYGLARELSAIFSVPLKSYDDIIGKIEDYSFQESKNKLSVTVSAKKKCRRYMALKIDNIKVGPSPEWLKNRLTAINQKPINNIVDLANYVMFDLGQPLHTFDASKLEKIVVKEAGSSEKIKTLDNKERALLEDDLIISDGEKPVAIAGVIGSMDSQIDENSTAMILESANFEPNSVRKTAQNLGLRTEASVRFEKDLDPELAEKAIYRFVSLLSKIDENVKVINPVIDIYNQKIEEKEFELDLKWVFSKIGQEIPRDKVITYLKDLGFEIEEKEEGIIKVLTPSWRATKDIKGREDIVEEILRMFGYDNIKSSLPKEYLSTPEKNKARLLERKMKDVFVLKFSLFEVQNHSFVGEEQLKKLNIDFFHHLKLANPLSEINSILRQSLIPNLVLNVKNNQAKTDDLGFFEIGNTFFNVPGDLDKEPGSEERVPYQEKKIALALSRKESDVFVEAKSIISNFLQEILGFDKEVIFSNFENDNSPNWSKKGTGAKISVMDKDLGWVAPIDKEHSNNFNLKMGTALVELSFNKVFELFMSLPSFRLKQSSKYPAVVRDLCFVFSSDVLYNDVKRELESFDSLIKSVDLFDVYSGDKLEDDKKSLAFHLYYQDENKTLTSEEVDQVQKRLVEYIADKFKAKLRDF